MFNRMKMYLKKKTFVSRMCKNILLGPAEGWRELCLTIWSLAAGGEP